MDVTSILGGVPIGKDASGNFRLSINGELAVRANGERFVVQRRDERTGRRRLVDVTGFTLDGTESYIYRLPATEVEPGDVIITSEDPFIALFVEDVQGDGTITGQNPQTNTRDVYSPVEHLLFRNRLFVKVVNMLHQALGDREFNNSSLPALLLLGGNMGDWLEKILIIRTLSEGEYALPDFENPQPPGIRQTGARGWRRSTEGAATTREASKVPTRDSESLQHPPNFHGGVGDTYRPEEAATTSEDDDSATRDDNQDEDDTK